jgi:hypothetical protein
MRKATSAITSVSTLISQCIILRNSTCNLDLSVIYFHVFKSLGLVCYCDKIKFIPLQIKPFVLKIDNIKRLFLIPLNSYSSDYNDSVDKIVAVSRKD